MTTERPPAVSVLIPVRDGAAYVGSAVASVLEQSLRDIEVIVVDDGSSDDSVAIISALASQDARLLLHAQPALGIVAALNFAAERARAPLVARMDADDLSYPTRLAQQRELLLSDESLAGVSCLVRSIDCGDAAPDGAAIANSGWLRYMKWLDSIRTADEIDRGLLIESPLAHPTVMLRRVVFEQVGGYRAIDGPEDYDLWLRIARAGGRFAKVPEVLLDWRDHQTRLTRTDERYRTEAFTKLKAEHLAWLLHKHAAGRKIVIWGAGRYGRQLGRHLEAEAVKIVAYVDVDPRKVGNQRRGCPVLDPAGLTELARAQSERPFVITAVPIEQARQRIRKHLDDEGWREGSDYFVCA